ncbi:MAG: hypothetical protein NTV32_07645 [Gammaproteobacteria bacterium]|nr:hypothetical protein [Gammaproteobacteria bacterium]
MKSNIKIVIWLIIFALIVSLPILHAGFFGGDDPLNSSAIGAVKALHLNIWQYTVQNDLGISLSQRRIFLFGFTSMPLFYYFPDSTQVQIVRLIFIWASLISVAWLVGLLTKNIKASFGFILLIPLFWSIRNFGDPLVSYGLALQLLVLFMMLSLVGYVQFHEKKHWLWLLGSIISYALAVLIYEPGITTFFCLMILVWFKRDSIQQFLLCMLPYVLLTLIYGVACLIVRHHAALYNGVAVGHFDFKVILTFLYQLTAPFPLDYGILSGHFFKPIVFVQFFTKPDSVVCLAILAVVSYQLFKALLPQLRLDHKSRRLLTVLALPLCIIPALLIAITEKYRDVLAWGLAYLPIYIEYIGFTLLLLVCLSKIKNTQKKWPAALFSLLICMSFIFNTYSVNRENDHFKYPRILQVEAFQQGLLQNVPSNALVLSKNFWVSSNFFLQNANVSLQSFNLTLQSGQVNLKNQPVYFMLTQNVPFTVNGTVTLGRVTALDYVLMDDQEKVSGMTFQDVRVFSAFGHEKKMIGLPGVQHVVVSWQCIPHSEAPCFSFLNKGP